MFNGYFIEEHLKPELVGILANHPIVHVEFREQIFDLFLAAFGDVPAPWPLLPIELESLETELEFKDRGIDLRSKSFKDWSDGIIMEYLKKSLSCGWPLDWHFTEAVLIPSKSDHDKIAGELKSILDSGGEPSSQSLEAGVAVAQALGWCGLRAPTEGFNWIMVFNQDKKAGITQFLDAAVKLGAEARLVHAANRGLSM